MNNRRKVTIGPGAVMICGKCGDVLGMVRKGIKSIRLTVLCRCGDIKVFVYKENKKESGGYARYCRDDMICPICGKVIFRIKNDSCKNFAFRARCSCGALYDKYIEAEEVKRPLGVFASLDG